jgi:hypothetical protein
MSGPTNPDLSGRHLEALRNALPADALRPAPSAEEVTVQNFRFMADMLPEWTFTRARVVEADNGVRLVQMTARSGNNEAQALRVEVYETPATEAAREVLLHVLTGFQVSPAQQLAIAPDVGEVRVSLGAALVFTRGNLVVALFNIGAAPAPLEAIAQGLDAAVIKRPTVVEMDSDPQDEGVALESVGARGTARSRSMVSAAPPTEPPTIKVFKRHSIGSGPEQPGDREVFAIAPDGSARRLSRDPPGGHDG